MRLGSSDLLLAQGFSFNNEVMAYVCVEQTDCNFFISSIWNLRNTFLGDIDRGRGQFVGNPYNPLAGVKLFFAAGMGLCLDV